MEVHPDEVVAMGAALQGTVLQIREGKANLTEVKSFPLVEIKDVNSHSMGVVAVDETGRETNAIVLKKNTPIPCRVSDIFHTVVESQTQLHVQVTEGEDTVLAYVKVVGEGTMPIPPYPKGAPIEVFFEYDHNGIIHVTVFDMTGNKRLGELQIKRTSNLSEEQVTEKQRKMSQVAVN